MSDSGKSEEIEKRRKSIVNRNLIIAAHSGDEEKVRRLIQTKPGADVNFVDDDGNTALLYAVKSGKADVVKMLLENQADLTVENKINENCVDLAKKNQVVLGVLEEKLVELSNDNLKGFYENEPCMHPIDDDDDDDDSDEINTVLELELANLRSKHDPKTKLKKPSTSNSYKPLEKESTTTTKRDEAPLFVVIWEIVKSDESKAGKKETLFKLINESDLFETLSLSQEKDLMLIVNSSENTKATRPGWAVLAIFGQTNQYACYIASAGLNSKKPVSEWMTGNGKSIENYVIAQKGSRLRNSAAYALKHLEIINEQRDNFVELKTKLSDIEKRPARSFESIHDTRSKILKCEKHLKELPKQQKPEELLYKKANCLIYFLETFAFCGEGDVELKKIKKDYFTRFYDKDDLELITDLRMFLLKTPKKHIGLPEIGKLFHNEGDWNATFNLLIDYVSQVVGRIMHPETGKSKRKRRGVKDILKKMNESDEDSMQNRNESNFPEEFAEIIKAGYESKASEKMRFHLLVNVYPSFEDIMKTHGDLKALRVLRNNLVHQFDAYDTPGFKKQIENLRELMYAYELAKNLYHSLSEIKSDDRPDKINDGLRDVIENFKKRFGEDFIIPEEDAKNDFALVDAELMYPVIRDMGIEELATEYLRFMSILENIEIDKSKINDVTRREIFDKFMSVMHVKEKRGEFKRELIEKYKVRPDYYDKVIKLGTDNGNVDVTAKETIIEIVKTLKSFREDHKLPLKQVIEYYESYAENKLQFGEKAKEAEEMLNRLPTEKYLTIEIGSQASVTIRVVETVTNILKIYSNPYFKHKLNSRSIETALKDFKVLAFLVRNDLKFCKKTETWNFKNRDNVVARIKKMLHYSYTAPYIAQLMTSVEDYDVIEKEDFEKLMGMLIKQKHKNLTKLLGRQKDPFNSYAMLYRNLIGSQENAQNEMKVIFEDHAHAGEFCKILKAAINEVVHDEDKNKKKVADFVKEFLKLLNVIALEFLEKERPQEAFNITKLTEEYVFDDKHKTLDENDPTVLEAKLIWARTEMDPTYFNVDDEEMQEKLERYLTSIERDKSIERRLSLRALCLLARLQCSRKNYEESGKLELRLYLEINEYVQPKQPIPNIEALTEQMYKRLAKNDKYENLITTWKEYDVLEIWGHRWAPDVIRTGSPIQDVPKFKEASKKYQSILNTRKTVYGQTHELTMKARENVVSVNDSTATLFRLIRLKKRQAKIFYCYYKALIHANILYRDLVERYGLFSPKVQEQRRVLRKVLLSFKLSRILYAQEPKNEEFRREFLKAGDLTRSSSMVYWSIHGEIPSSTEDATPLENWFINASSIKLNQYFDQLIEAAVSTSRVHKRQQKSWACSYCFKTFVTTKN